MSSPRISTLRRFLVVLVSLVSLLAGRAAWADGKGEGPAKALQKKAMEEDYLATEFAAAQTKLEKAIAQCSAEGCSAALRARLKRDLGVVQIGGGINKEQGIANFVEAIKLDPTLTLDPDLKTKELEQAFAEAKKKAAGGETGDKAPSKTPAKGADKGAAKPGPTQPEGDFVHTPVPLQQVRTAIPVYVEYEGDEELVRVLIRYKGFGMTEWKAVELRKLEGKGWGALIPCGDVQQGVTKYYIQGFDAANDPVAVGGDRNNPYRVKVTTDPVEDPPHLPNSAPPTQCADTGDCPPNFPGCHKGAGGAGAESAAEVTSEPTGKEGGEFCEEDSECKSNKCDNAKCTDYTPPQSAAKTTKWWVGVAGSFDYSFVPSANDVCKLKSDKTPLNDSNYYCTKTDGTDYPSREDPAQNDAIRLTSDKDGGNLDKVTGGGAIGNVRLLLAVDYVLRPNLLLGSRLGLVLNNYPGKEAEIDAKRFPVPLHFELRMTYLFGEGDALTTKGLAPYAFGGAGVGRFETHVPVTVREAPAGGEATSTKVDAWHLAGPAFVAVGGGVRYLVSPKFALTAGLRMNLAFINAFAPSIGPEIGGQFGL